MSSYFKSLLLLLTLSVGLFSDEKEPGPAIELGAPIRDATLVGDGPSVLRKVSMVGNDLELDEGVGVCGKDGQSVPVGVGQPTLRVDGLTVGGTGGG